MENRIEFKEISSGVYMIWISRSEDFKEDTFVTADVVVKAINDGYNVKILNNNNDLLYG